MSVKLINVVILFVIIIALIPIAGVLINVVLNYGRLIGTIARNINELIIL